MLSVTNRGAFLLQTVSIDSFLHQQTIVYLRLKETVNTLTFEKYCTTLLKMAANSGQGPALDDFNNMVLAVQSIHSPYLYS